MYLSCDIFCLRDEEHKTFQIIYNLGNIIHISQDIFVALGRQKCSQGIWDNKILFGSSSPIRRENINVLSIKSTNNVSLEPLWNGRKGKYHRLVVCLIENGGKTQKRQNETLEYAKMLKLKLVEERCQENDDSLFY